MRRAVMIPLAASALLIAAAPTLSQEQQRRPLPPPGGAVQQPRPLPPPGLATQQRGPQQQQPQQRTPQQQQAAPPPQAAPKPYQPVAIGAPKPVGDPSLDAFRNQLAEIAKRKDRASLAKLVAKDFFWLGEKGDKADKKRPGIDNLTRAMNLAAKDGSGWEALTGYAADPTGMALPDKKDTLCAPADPVFEIKQLEELAKQTGTNEAEWGYPVQPGVEVRAAAQPNAPVIEKLGMHFIRVMEDDGPEPPPNQMPMLKVVAPSGKVGFVPADAVSPLGNDQLCYVKGAAGWMIAGFVGGEQ
jgi:hypothetical protein